MSVSEYDKAIKAKLQKWIPQQSKLHVLSPEESTRFFEISADETNDAPFSLPLVSLTRNKDIEILSTTKDIRTFNGLCIEKTNDQSVKLNVIPIRLSYQLDIYTKFYDEGLEYVRNFLFKLINNPKLTVDIPYNDYWLQHTANLRVLNTVSDTSDISLHLFPGQFTKWSIQFELQDAFLFSIPYKQNWRLSNITLQPDNDPKEPVSCCIGDCPWPEENDPTINTSGKTKIEVDSKIKI